MKSGSKMKGKKKKAQKKEKTKTEEKGKGDPNDLLKKLAVQHNRQSLQIEADQVAHLAPADNEGVPHASSRMSSAGVSTNGDTELPEWFEDITTDNEDAFKELFDMLDSAKTGTLNVDGLYEGLKRVDSGITREEVEAVMNKLDKDGNGEIDFDEFLIHMTQGDTAGEGDQEGSRKGFSRRQRLFYTAITQFSMKTTLELEKKKHQPHVIGHYTAGARLEGLTDRQLARQMKRLQRTAVHHDSPYAKPLPFVSQMNCSVVPTSRYKLATERTEMGPKENTTLIEIPEDGPIEPIAPLPWKAQWKMFTSRDSVVGKTNDDLLNNLRSRLNITMKIKGSIKKKKTIAKAAIPQIGKCRVPLPVLRVKYIRHRPSPTIDDLPNIREKATNALDDYYHKLRKVSVKNSYEHWDNLYADTIRPKKLLENFRTVYRAYSPHKEEEAFVVTPWIPGPYRLFRRKVDSRIRPFSAH
ncbi:uncharacterized protein LOC127730974 [Mytilus californianus]|uniref:uncharacterized protein LOC127730974 n=1 Tax=Mytilus californianus TaxID=6549 RepID=UPI0022458A88|nr:uncharacterized protein LOC127730974 [Mytilus californianus]